MQNTVEVAQCGGCSEFDAISPQNLKSFCDFTVRTALSEERLCPAGRRQLDMSVTLNALGHDEKHFFFVD